MPFIYIECRKKIIHQCQLECKVCWWVYDPAQGDDVWQIPPGVPFSQLPDYWCCPVCETSKSGFMVLDEGNNSCKD
ncbi:rubredoxin [Salmonella enterica]|nr:rubredoxin [Salmonella enterica]